MDFGEICTVRPVQIERGVWCDTQREPVNEDVSGQALNLSDILLATVSVQTIRPTRGISEVASVLIRGEEKSTIRPLRSTLKNSRPSFGLSGLQANSHLLAVTPLPAIVCCVGSNTHKCTNSKFGDPQDQRILLCIEGSVIHIRNSQD